MSQHSSDPFRTPLGAPPEGHVSADARAVLNVPVFVGAAALVAVVAVVSLIAPDWAYDLTSTVVTWISSYFGWWYFALAAVLIVFVVVVCLSKYGRYRLGPEESRPEFNLFTWTAMLFAAGIGADVMFYSVAEPVAQYLHPPDAQGGNPEAAREAVTWTLFHYGISGWAMYAVLGMALGYFAFRHGLPLSIRSALYPIFGRRIHGAVGDAVDLAAVIGTIFGIATSLGISIALLNVGLNVMFDIPVGRGAQVGLIVAAVVLGTASAVSGVDKGIRRLSELNVLLSVALMLFILFADNTSFLLNSLVMNLGDYASRLPGMSLDTMAYLDAEGATVSGDPATTVTAWKGLWTLFFWAWWVAWSPFVGLFLARISRGRTIRQFLVGVMMIPFGFILLWVSIFGNSAIREIRGGNAEFGELTYGDGAVGFYTFLDQYSGAGLIIAVATLTGFLYYVTSADSGALVMGNFTSRLPHPMADCTIPVRIFWSLAIGVLTLAMLVAGGENWLTQLTNITVIMGLPFSFVLALVAIGLYRALRLEGLKTESLRVSLPGQISVARAHAVDGTHLSAAQRLRRTFTYPSQRDTERFLVQVARPALEQVAAEFDQHGLEATVVECEPATSAGSVLPGLQLTVALGEEPAFIYHLAPIPARAPTFAKGRVSTERYYRTEVYLAEGTQGYSVNGYSRDQVAGDVLDQYERHMSYLHLVHESDTGRAEPTET
ncbi:choline BCCT transporter BetT [Nocardioides insulae]|uniref:choline BCCT transporter BetT n=1 Tax=Nocardioides insulae TaxID=394734 RepID=UPI00042706F6|nr:choline BCCT transporter BetT [Nocardioides insulae]